MVGYEEALKYCIVSNSVIGREGDYDNGSNTSNNDNSTSFYVCTSRLPLKDRKKLKNLAGQDSTR